MTDLKREAALRAVLASLSDAGVEVFDGQWGDVRLGSDTPPSSFPGTATDPLGCGHSVPPDTTPKPAHADTESPRRASLAGGGAPQCNTGADH